MVIERPLHGNHSSTVCMREYEVGTSASEFNTTQSGETFDWTNRQSGLMLGTRAVRTYLRAIRTRMFDLLNRFKSPEKVDITTDTQQ